MTLPPHLPPASCNLKWHERLLTLPWLLLLVCLAMLAGVSAALATVAWIAPPLYNTQNFSLFDVRGEEAALDPAVAIAVRQRLVTFFDASKNVGGSVYPESAFAAYGALLSSDGWVVLSDAAYRPGREQQWEARDAQGIAHAIERAVADPVGHVVYIKLSGSGFRVFSFPDWRTLEEGSAVWLQDAAPGRARRTQWRMATLGPSARASAENIFSAVRPEYRFSLSGNPAHGSILVSDRGELAGFADDRGRLIPAWFVAGQTAAVLSEKPIRYGHLGIEGYFAEGVTEGAGAFFSGFFVSKAPVATGLKRGDVLLMVSGESADHEQLSRQLLLSPDEVGATVLRGGVEQEITLRRGA